LELNILIMTALIKHKPKASKITPVSAPNWVFKWIGVNCAPCSGHNFFCIIQDHWNKSHDRDLGIKDDYSLRPSATIPLEGGRYGLMLVSIWTIFWGNGI
jgi:hypothetical protein